MRYAMSNCTKTVSTDGRYVKLDGESVGGRPFSITVEQADMSRYLFGTLIQDAFPYLSATEREVCISGMDAEDWKEMCDGLDAEEEDEMDKLDDDDLLMIDEDY